MNLVRAVYGRSTGFRKLLRVDSVRDKLRLYLPERTIVLHLRAPSLGRFCVPGGSLFIVDVDDNGKEYRAVRYCWDGHTGWGYRHDRYELGHAYTYLVYPDGRYGEISREVENDRPLFKCPVCHINCRRDSGIIVGDDCEILVCSCLCVGIVFAATSKEIDEWLRLQQKRELARVKRMGVLMGAASRAACRNGPEAQNSLRGVLTELETL